MNLVTRRLAATVLAMGLVVPAFAAPVTYTIDSSHTFPRISYNHLGLSTQLSRFNQTSGTVVYDKAQQTASVDVVIDMKSVDTGFATFNEHIQGADFLDTAKYPTTTIKRSDFNAGQYVPAVGDELTISIALEAVQQ